MLRMTTIFFKKSKSTSEMNKNGVVPIPKYFQNTNKEVNLIKRESKQSMALTPNNNASKLSFTSKEIVYSIGFKSTSEKSSFNQLLFSRASIKMTSTPTSEFCDTIRPNSTRLKFYKAFNGYNVLEKKKFINLLELT